MLLNKAIPRLLLVLTLITVVVVFGESLGQKKIFSVENAVTLPPLPIRKETVVDPEVFARSILVVDRASNVTLWEHNADLRVPPASTTKMMTALVAMEKFPLDQVITVSRSYKIGQSVGFKPGDKVSVEQLLFSLLVYSGNDAAEILAENYEGGRPAFIVAMNAKVDELGLKNTHFVNPTGLDEASHYSTARDLAILADIAMKKIEFAKIVSSESTVIALENNQEYVLKNVNQLLGKIPGVLGVKTGFTEGAGQSLVTLVSRNEHEVILSVLGSGDRFMETEKLIDWVYASFTWLTLDRHNPGKSLGQKP
ncbi:MAG: D-alanyl-D-alanine carboxypeptidase family protein [Patescibacteria group bacterium]